MSERATLAATPAPAPAATPAAIPAPTTVVTPAPATAVAPGSTTAAIPASTKAVRPSMLSLSARIHAQTPEGRDRSVDALRALAILGVVLGHWMVTAFVATGGPATPATGGLATGGPAAGGQLHVVSPLASQPVLVPVSWLLQTLAVFFLVGGYAGARSLGSARRSGQAYASWLSARMSRLARPVLALLMFWVPTAYVLGSLGLSSESLRTLRSIVVSPLWFVAVYAGLVALTPLVVAGWRRWGGHLVVLSVCAVALVDLVRLALDGPAWLGWLNLAAGWLVPYCLGVAWAHGARFSPVALLAGGAAATAALVHWFGYPASMVGVPGEGRSNLNPPTLAAVTFGLAQVGLALLLRGVLARWMRRPLAWTVVALVNLSAMTIFLWHQTAMIAVTTFALGYGHLPGLHTMPDDPSWILNRLAWLPTFAAALAVFAAIFRHFEHPRRTSRPSRSSHLPIQQPIALSYRPKCSTDVPIK